MDASDTSFRENFEAKLTEYEEEHRGNTRKPWSQNKVLEVIQNIQNAKVSMSLQQRRTSMEYYWMSKYDVMTIDNEDYLIFKRKSPDDPAVRVIPRNEYFGVLLDTHKSCGHGGRDKMTHAIKSRYYIPRKAIEIFIALCPTCETKKNLPQKGITQAQDFNMLGHVDLKDYQSCSNGEQKWFSHYRDYATKVRTCENKKNLSPKNVVQQPIISEDFNSLGLVSLMDFQSCPDGEFKWLLNYQDNATKFLNLCPLKTEQANEVALELMKIFMIFGAPYVLQSGNGREFTAKVVQELTAIWPECNIILGNSKHPQTQRTNQDVKNMLRSWMTDNNSTNWSIGCYHVQYKKNASFHRTIGKSPHKALFGSDPKAGLSSSPIPSSILKNIETEEQLRNILSEPEPSCSNDAK